MIKPALLADHLTGAALLMLLGFRRASIGWLIFLFIGMALASTQNRGGMFAIIISLTFALILTGKWRKLAVIVVTSAGLLGLLYLLDLSVPGHARDISARQLVENFSVLSVPRTQLTLRRRRIGASHGGTRSSAIHSRVRTFGPARVLGSIWQ